MQRALTALTLAACVYGLACSKRPAPAPTPVLTDEQIAAGLCSKTGGVVYEATCCGMTNDFPSDCAPGPCSCSPDSSHRVKACRCPASQCFWPDAGCAARQ